MTENLFLDWATKLLEQIETSEEKKPPLFRVFP